MSYDPLGRLRQVVAGGVTTLFLYDGDRLVGEYNGAGALQRRYVHGPGVDEPLVWVEGAGLADKRWLASDRQGSVIAAANSTGAMVGAAYAYGPYGEPDAANGWSGSRFRYTGQIALPELQLYHYKARVYDPGLGRFLQTDPVGYFGGLNLQEYVGSDPINFSDPSGLYKCEGTPAECERIKRYIDQIRERAREERRRSIRMPRVVQYAIRVSRFYGGDGEENGVIVTNRNVPGDIEGEASETDDGGVEIAFDLSRIETLERAGFDLAGLMVAVHEGWHGIQFGGPYSLETRGARYAFELGAYQAHVSVLLAAGSEEYARMTPLERQQHIRNGAEASSSRRH